MCEKQQNSVALGRDSLTCLCNNEFIQREIRESTNLLARDSDGHGCNVLSRRERVQEETPLEWASGESLVKVDTLENGTEGNGEGAIAG